ncbi:MAG: O-antigen ligase family protein, partial [Acidimicrobiales bacterium]
MAVLARLVGALDHWGLVVFLWALIADAVFLARVARETSLGPANPWRAARRVVLVVGLVAVPVVFDTGSADVFNLVKATVLVVLALGLAGLATAEALRTGRWPRWRHGLAVPALALVGWMALATAASTHPRLSLLGAYGSYDGLVVTAALVVVLFGVAEAFEPPELGRLLWVLFVGAGGPVVVYGALQLHDRLLGGGRWDWVHWGALSFANASIWSSFGNPNHLAGFLVTLLPLGLVLVALSRDRRARAVVAAMTGLMALELVHTGTRGALLAVPVALLAMALFVTPELRARPRLVLAVPAGFLALVAVAGAVVGFRQYQITRLFAGNGAGSIRERLEFWRAAGHMVARRPVLGIGPDVFALRFPRFQSAAFVRLEGPYVLANGPHDTFIDHLVAQGVPGLLLWVGVLGLAGLMVHGALRRLAARDRNASEATSETAWRDRLVLAGVAGALVAWVVQASFDVEQVGVSFVLWALLGLVVLAARGAGVPDSLRPSRLWRVAGAGEDPVGDEEAVAAPGGPKPPAGARGVPNRSRPGPRGRARRRPSRPGSGPWVAGLAAAGLLATLVIARPWWADHAAHAGQAAVALADHVSTVEP